MLSEIISKHSDTKQDTTNLAGRLLPPPPPSGSATVFYVFVLFDPHSVMKWKDRQGCPSCRRGLNIGDCILQVNAQKLMSKDNFLHFVVSSAEEMVRSKS